MVRHIVAWNHKNEFTDAEKKQHALKIKSDLEALVGHIDGLIEMKVYVDTLPSGNRDMTLTSLLQSEDALAAYRIHPDHQKVSAYVGTVMQDRVCIDYHE